MRDYLTRADVLAIHADQIATYGGAGGLRDPGQLEAALFRPQSGYYEDEIAEAAALWESLSQNHPFVDGNKRTAFASAYTFLAINGIEVTAEIDLTPYHIVCTHGWRGVVQTQQPEIVLPQGDVLEGGVVQVTKDSARDLQLGSIDIDVFVPQRQEVCSGQEPFRVVIQERDIECPLVRV